MREINNNNNQQSINFQKIEKKAEQPQVSCEGQQEVTSHLSETKDLSLQPQAVIGRSMVHMTGASGVDNIGEDMKVALENPKTVEMANKFFDLAYRQLKESGSENPYEEAAALTEAFQKEIS